ncbi:hypothetical protein [Tabrizicola sp.]|uniref:hypothetical protein n=1 Tax=Tabrizicola sp. TaxID=2005166 RepID=UPI0025E48690|nr:hypothetical protein [Tabrizicola sp.]
MSRRPEGWATDRKLTSVRQCPFGTPQRTIREKFGTCRFSGHEERVADLLARVVLVRVETIVVEAEIAAARREA